MRKKTLTFIITVISPLLPVLATIIFNRIGDALPLLITCLIILIVVLWSMVALVRVNEKSPAMKIIGTVMGIIGLITTAGFGIISGLSYTKI